MAKKEYDHFVTSLIDMKSFISNMKLLTNVIAIDPEQNFVYMTPQNDSHDCFAVITNSDTYKASREFTYHIINTVEAVGFNKALKKSKTVSEILDNKNIRFTTDGYDDVLELISLKDYTDITKRYRKLFKDEDLTKKALAAIYNHDYKRLSYSNMVGLRNGDLIMEESTSGNTIFISKYIFGNIKKTIDIEHLVIDSDDSSEVVMFRQIEDGFEVYHLIRFLIT